MTLLSNCIPSVPVSRPATRSVTLATALLAGLLLVVLTVSLSRCVFYPLGQDQAFYQYVTKMTMDGYRESVAREVKFYSAFVVLQWAAIKLFGYTETGFHTFDACWQLLTLAALFGLAGRERRWSVGLLACTLYAIVYYGMNYQVINGRDACAALPMLLMVHALIPLRATNGSQRRPLALCVVAGAMGFWAYILKLTLGMAFGAAWIYLLVEAYQSWRSAKSNRWRGVLEVGALSAGFLGTAGIWATLMLRANWWDDWSALYSAFPPKGYNTGHWMMLELTPRVLAGALIVATVLAAAVLPALRALPKGEARTQAIGQLAWLIIGGAVVFGLAATIKSWFEWTKALLSIGGLFVPAVGGMLGISWRERTFAWRMCLLLAGVSMFSIFLQGNFWVYHFVPLVLFLAYLAADEVGRVLDKVARGQLAQGGWAAACLASLASLFVMLWWPYMTSQTTGLNVLGKHSLADYHTRVASHITHVPEYPTAIKAAQRAREMTQPGEPIACLFLDTRIYYFADRPMAHGLAFIFCRGWEKWYADYMQSVREKRPKAVMARIPLSYTGPRDIASVEQVVMKDLEEKFGPCASTIRELYHVCEVIDDVAILTWVRPDMQVARSAG